MNNFQQHGDVVTLIAPAAVASGQGVQAGSLFGIAVGAAAAGAEVEVNREGVFTHTKNSAEAWTVGAKIYWDNVNKRFTTVATANLLVGAALEVAVNPSATGTVLLDGAIR